MKERIQPRLVIEGSASKRSPEEQQRLIDEYDNQIYDSGIDEDAYNEAMAKHEYEKNVEIEGRIMSSQELRRMYMMAQQIAELKAANGETEIIADKEDKLQELLVSYADTANRTRDIEFRNAETERDTVKGRDIRLGKEIAAEEEREKSLEEIDFIVNATEESTQAESSKDKLTGDDQEDSDTSSGDDADIDPVSLPAEPAHENESREEYEARVSSGGNNDPLPTDELDKIAGDGRVPTPENSPLPTGDLDAIANASVGTNEPAPSSSSGVRARDWLRHPLASASERAVNARSGARAERQVDNRSRRKKLLAGFALFGGAIGGGLLLMKGHDIFGYLNDNQGNGGSNGVGNGHGQGQGQGNGGGNGHGNGGGHEILKSVRVKPGDGEIKVAQSILEQQGIHVNTTDAQRIGEHANVDLLLRDNNYNDAQSTLDRIGATPGKYKIRPGSAEALVKSARELGFKR